MQIQLTQHITLAEVKAILQVIGCARHVKHAHSTCSVHSQRVIDCICTIDGKCGHLSLLDNSRVLDVRGVVRAISEGIHLVGRYLYAVSSIGNIAGNVHVNIVRSEVARPILSIKQCETILDEVLTMGDVRTLQGIDKRP